MGATIWRGRIAFGLVSIPVRLYKAARRERVQFHNVYQPAGTPTAEEGRPVPPEASAAPDPRSKVRTFPAPPFPAEEQEPRPERVARVHAAWVGEESKAPLAKDEILKGYEVEPDQYVVLKPSEVAALRARASTNLEIAEFVGLNEIDRNYFDASYYIAPDAGAEKAYALFYRALAETGCVAVGELVMYGREYPVVVRPGGRGLVLHTLFFANEVRVQAEVPADLGLVEIKELDLAKMLIGAQRGTFDASKLKDKFRERVLEVVEKRAPVPGGSHGEPRGGAPVVDIMEALRKSLEKVRKPAQSEDGDRKPRDRRRTK